MIPIELDPAEGRAIARGAFRIDGLKQASKIFFFSNEQQKTLSRAFGFVFY